MRIILYLIFSLALAGCIKEIKPVTRTPEPQLVVEGLLLTDSTPCKVVLSYSGAFNYRGSQAQDFEDGATVFLMNDTGDSTPLVNQGNGTYIQTGNGFIAETGRSYFITIALPNGERYASIPEKIVPVTKNFELDTVAQAKPFRLDDLSGADVQIKMQDPADETNYYRWITIDYLSRKATGCCCAPYPCFQYCYQYYEDPYVNILSDANVNGNEIKGQSVLVSPYYYFGFLYLNIKQLSLTRQAYEFWKLYNEQTTRTGTILDPLPSSLVGNIYNVNDTSHIALGYFEASDVFSKKMTLTPLFIHPYITLRNVQHYIGTGACYEIYPNATTDGPEGWETAPVYLYDVN